MSMKEDYTQKLQHQLDEWNVEVERLFKSLPMVDSETRQQFEEQIESLTTQQDAASRKLAELRAAGDDVWEDLKAGMESTWMDLSEAIKKMGAGLEKG